MSFTDAVNKLVPDSDFVLGHSQPLSFEPSSSSGGGEDDRFMLTDAERDTRDRAIKRAAKKGLPKPEKRPREVTPEPHTLSIHEYFEMTAIPLAQRASICRAYASYVKAEAPPAPRKQKK